MLSVQAAIRRLAQNDPFGSFKDRNVFLKKVAGIVIMVPAGLFNSVTAGVRTAAPAESVVSLTQAPLVMRLSKDQFRLAFGINGDQCFPSGCSGSIRYRVIWTAEDGLIRSEIRKVSYAVAPNSRRSITVDRQYFDTAEGEHTTKVVSVSVDLITCRKGAATEMPAARGARGPTVPGSTP